MRIMDMKNNSINTTLKSVLIMLTPEEALELWSLTKNIDPSRGDHIHVDDAEYKRQITVAIYTEENLHFFREDVRKVISEP